MAAPIKYDGIHLYNQYAHFESVEFKTWLKDNNISFTDLQYTEDAVPAALAPLSTWFYDENNEKVLFSDMPVLIFDAVYWEADDGSDRYTKRMYATSIETLPENFLELAIKIDP